jgi:probable F420-dependent oxidoreductase
LKIGVFTLPTDYSVDVAVLAKRAEELGFESFWVAEHPFIPVTTTTPFPRSSDGVFPREYVRMCDPFVALARASAVTNKIKLGTGVCLVPERDPLLLAKEVATLDYFSGGRFIFGVGAGWVKEQVELLGADFSHRWGQTREAIQALKALWTNEVAEHHGKYYDFPPVYSFPKPAQRPHPPIFIGATRSVGGNIFNRVVELGDGWLPTQTSPEEVARGRKILDELATKAGRDPSSIQVWVYWAPADAGALKAFDEAGADAAVIRLEPAPEAEALADIEDVARKVL